MSAMPQLIEMEGVGRTYLMAGEEIAALSDINLKIRANDYVAIVGSSGSGKSTMMNILGCLDRPSSGSYRLDGRDVSTLSQRDLATIRNRQIGFIFQNFSLLPRATALQNVMQPLVYRGVRHRERAERALVALTRVGLVNRGTHLPNQLSGGQRQRVAIARALCAEPSLLIADEPTGNLDSATSTEIMDLFDELHAEGQTIIMVTHEPDIAQHCRRRVTLSDGRIVEDSSA